MAETLISPGVLQRENDQSFITQQPVQVGAAVVGPTVKGPVEIPTVVTSYSDYQNRFGTTFLSASEEFSFLTSIQAYNYFQNGGNTLLVTRVVSGSSNWGYASADVYTSEGESGNLSTATDNLLSATINAFNITGSALTEVTDINPTGGSGTGAEVKLTLATSQSFGTITVTDAGSGYAVGDILTIPSASAGATKPNGTDLTFTLVDANIVDEVAFTLEAIDKGVIFNNSGSQLSNGALSSGSADNIRWEIAASSSAQGTFDLLIRRGNDNTNNKVVLESFTGLSLDPTQDNYVARVIGDYKYQYDETNNYVKIVSGSHPNASRYVRVKSVTAKTPNYFDNAGVAKTEYTGKIPAFGSGSNGGAFTGGTGTVINAQEANNMYQYIGNGTNKVTQGLIGSDYTNMLNLLANQDDYQFNVLTTPGLLRSEHASPITTAINNVQSRGDAIYIIDPSQYGSAITGTDSPVEEAGTINSSYGAMYWPWLQTSDPDTGDNVWVPASTMIPGVYAFNDNSSEPWFAPAGINRGGLSTVIRPERKLSQANRDTLYNAKVNPIASFPGVGTVVYGQKTLQTQASALDRVNVRRLLIALKSYIGQISQTLVFEQNTAATRNNFLAQVNPYLESVQQRQGLYAFKVVMDDSNNTPDVIDRNQMVGQIFLQPTKTAEFIILDFNVLPTGATFPA
ncbi:phage tail sheath subtilisin-like domain-containing protein [bacterium]|nr:phage tail sheath subtilisin-like domain-containing protein [bacterium]